MKKYKDRSISKEFDDRLFYKTSEYVMTIAGCDFPIDYMLCIDDSDFSYKEHYIIISRKHSKRFSPDKINNSYFWKRASELSTFTFCRINECKNKDDVNRINFNKIHINFIKFIDTQLSKDKNARILEIGPGLGNILEYVEQNFNIENYYGIDINKYFESDRIFKCDGKSIPETIKTDFDIIYSINVFQHLSKKQRNGYFRSVKKYLKDDGVFIFSLFCVTETNKDLKIPCDKEKDKEKPLFGIKNEDGRFLSLFYNQFIVIPTLDEIKSELNDAGLKIFDLRENFNSVAFVVIK